MAVTVRDPIHGSIRIEDWTLPLVDNPVFQRLRRIQQLGTAHLVYPGARHSRFEHSLGAHHIAKLLAHGLGLEEEQARTAAAAALLHDVGHGPFSHAFDELLKEQGRRHEETTVDLVRWGPLADPLRRSGLDPVAVAEAVLGQGPLAPIVSGALDADRMDYLMRDAHYTGVKSNVDPQRLAAEVYYDDDAGIVLEEGGLIAAEALLTTRFLMYPSVYLHHTVRASEAMLMHAVRLHLEGGGALGDLERDTDDELLGRLRSSNPEATELVRRVDERRLYKRAVQIGPEHAESDAILALQKDPQKRRQWADVLANAAGVPAHHVIVDVPHAPKFREMAMHVRTMDGTIKPLGEASSLVRVLQEARFDHWRAWVFAHPKSRDAVAAAARRAGPIQVA